MTVTQAESVLKTALKAWTSDTENGPLCHGRNGIEHMQLFVDLMKQQREKVVRILMWEIGKSSKDAYKEFDRTIEYIEKTIIEYRLLNEGTDESEKPKVYLPVFLELHLVWFFVWDHLTIRSMKHSTVIIPALIMGNVVIFKPAKYGILLMEPLIECFATAFPKEL
jgi:glyceraldehyde-3-phosphate dehydrogenase (NADP+)